MTKRFLQFAPILAGLIILLPAAVSAAGFTISPAKIEIHLSPGETVIETITVSNDLDRTARFVVSVEDFIGSESDTEAVLLLEEEASPYSLKRYLEVGVVDFTLIPGQSRNIPVLIDLPASAPPGGLYAAVLVSTETVGTGPITPTVRTRAGSLFFVRVEGEVNETGKTTGFGMLSGRIKFFSDGQFYINYKNDGNVYLNPYGLISIKNLFGQNISVVPIDPWFVMPDDERIRETAAVSLPGRGIYKAELLMNRGYGDVIDQRSFYFASIQAVPASIGLLVLLLLVWVIIKLKKYAKR